MSASTSQLLACVGKRKGPCHAPMCFCTPPRTRQGPAARRTLPHKPAVGRVLHQCQARLVVQPTHRTLHTAHNRRAVEHAHALHAHMHTPTHIMCHTTGARDAVEREVGRGRAGWLDAHNQSKQNESLHPAWPTYQDSVLRVDPPSRTPPRLPVPPTTPKTRKHAEHTAACKPQVTLT